MFKHYACPCMLCLAILVQRQAADATWIERSGDCANNQYGCDGGLGCIDNKCADNALFSFSDLKTNKKKCGIEHGKDYWALEGNFTLINKNHFCPRVLILIDGAEICRINLTTCPPASVASSGSLCYCSANVSNKYTLHVRQLANIDDRNDPLAFYYQAQKFTHNGIDSSKTAIESLPFVFRTAKATSDVQWGVENGMRQIHLNTSHLDATQNLHVGPVSEVKVTFCVSDLVPKYTLSIDDLTEEFTETELYPCVSKLLESSGQVALSYAEFGGCKRTRMYNTLHIVACPAGRFGLHCTKDCHCREGTDCDGTGHCPDGCRPGWDGESCSSVTPAQLTTAAPTETVTSRELTSPATGSNPRHGSASTLVKSSVSPTNSSVKLDPTNKNAGLSKTNVGLLVGCIVAALFIGFEVVYYIRKRKIRGANDETAEQADTDLGTGETSGGNVKEENKQIEDTTDGDDVSIQSDDGGGDDGDV